MKNVLAELRQFTLQVNRVPLKTALKRENENSSYAADKSASMRYWGGIVRASCSGVGYKESLLTRLAPG